MSTENFQKEHTSERNISEPISNPINPPLEENPNPSEIKTILPDSIDNVKNMFQPLNDKISNIDEIFESAEKVPSKEEIKIITEEIPTTKTITTTTTVIKTITTNKDGKESTTKEIVTNVDENKEKINNGSKITKESDDNEEDNDYTLDIDKDIFGYEIFKKDENEKSYNNKDFSEQQGRFSQPMSCPQQTTNFNLNQCDDSFFCSPLGRFSYNCPQYQNKKESINQIINSPYHNQLNFFNNSFTMNGKSGWVCAHCKNFNYESKSILININIFYFY